MKPQESDPDREGSRNHIYCLPCRRIWCFFLLLPAAGFLFTACENNLDKIKTFSSLENLPDASGKQYEILYSDSFRVQVRILAPEIESYDRIEDPCIKFPEGMTAYFYNDSLEIEAYIKARDVVYFKKEQLWEARNNVEGRNLSNGNQLNTEHLFWDEKKNLIYSATRSRIVNKDGTFYGENGFEAKQDLSWYRLKKSKGVVILKDE